MMSGLLRGAAAGAAGTTALNTVTYADMAWRGRPASDVPQSVVERLSEAAGRPVPNGDGRRGNRLAGLGALSGIAVGTGVGAALGALRAAGVRMPVWAGGALAGALAMAATDAPVARLGVSDPRSWSAGDWISDAVPHLVYGLVAYALLDALDR
ncbi:hypothetical protein [Marinitenerispora sediminis]|uniref:DUF1440 domain-containing protein n=1 Tax=Marinitenerispora sediminis TaxID=1931232 RepID=A0A368T4M7_9ACTN|nr:hypothetical protein [Marinitenerispora sediminis]RCV50346.1 hypothetical protein DEF28_18330 [Marinitenerispora sediminis]RCV53623.1 hypothetical protein DEF23_17195 [Marinitenerispora sediminis]RCV57918.1 hypothetical protein DEF24_14360 [Marinitenerispora sediminis]